MNTPMARKGTLAVLFFLVALVLLPVIYPALRDYAHEEKMLSRYAVLFTIKVLLLLIGMFTVARWMHRSQTMRGWLYASTFMGILFAIVLATYHSTEKKLRRNGMKPGVLFAGYDYSDSLVVDQYVISDHEGINRFGRPMPWLKERQLNAQGFICPFNFDLASIDSLRKSGKPVISLFGDSFLEGVSENLHVDSTFLELIRRQHPDWALASFGVGGTGPADYARCAEKYLPTINPDIVVVVFYAGNDIMLYDVPPTPGVPNFWHTNCGWLESTVQKEFTGGEYIVLNTPESAYIYYRDRFTLFGKNDLESKYFRQSRVLTRLYCDIFNEPETFHVAIDSNITHSYLQKIHSRALSPGSRLVIAFIPDMNKLDLVLPENQHRYEWVFKDLFPFVHIPVNLTRNDYMENNRHFNDSGNRKFSMFLDSLISAELLKGQRDTARHL